MRTYDIQPGSTRLPIQRTQCLKISVALCIATSSHVQRRALSTNDALSKKPQRREVAENPLSILLGRGIRVLFAVLIP